METETAAPVKSGVPDAKVVPFLRAVEGGRNIEANVVLAEFARVTEKLSVEANPMAGFAVVLWDDQGQMQSHVYAGERTPFSTMLIPKFASDLFTADIMVP